MWRVKGQVDFFAWLDSLSDEEHHAVFEELRVIIATLGCRINHNPPLPHKPLQLPPHQVTMISLN